MTIYKHRSTQLEDIPATEVESIYSKFSLTNVIKKYFRRVFKELGVKLKEERSKRNSDGSITHTLTFMYTTDNGDKELDFYMNAKPTDKSNTTVDLSFMYPDLAADPSGQKMKKSIDEYTDVPNEHDAIMKKCQQFLDNVFQWDSFEDVPKDLSVKPKDVFSSEKILKFDINHTKSNKIKLSKIYANYDPTEAVVDINTIISDSEFVNSIVKDDSPTYGALVSADGYDIQNIPNFDDTSCQADYLQLAYFMILKHVYKLYFLCKHCKYTACGVYMDKVCAYAEGFEFYLNEMIDMLNRRMIADANTDARIDYIPPIVEIQLSVVWDSAVIPEAVSWGEFLTLMNNEIHELVSILSLYVNNFSREKKMEILEWIRKWTYDLDYTLTQAAK